MTQVPMKASLTSALSGLKKAFGESREVGERLPWPFEPVGGVAECDVLSLSVKESNDAFSYNDGGKRISLPSISFQWRYRWVNNPNGDDNYIWNGSFAAVPSNPAHIASLPENQQMRVSIALGRIKHNLHKFLGDEFVEDDLEYCVQKAQEKLAAADKSNTVLTMRVRTSFRDGKDKSGQPKKFPEADVILGYVGDEDSD